LVSIVVFYKEHIYHVVSFFFSMFRRNGLRDARARRVAQHNSPGSIYNKGNKNNSQGFENRAMDLPYIYILQMFDPTKSLQDQFAPHNACFGCGPANIKGLRIKSYIEDGLVIAS